MKQNMPRKTVDGDIRNRERTSEKLIDAVGSVLAAEGYGKLRINRVAKEAMVDKNLIYRYFGSFEGLVSAYFRTRDFWIRLNDAHSGDREKAGQNDFGEQLAKDLLTGLLDYVGNTKEAQKILLCEISEKNKALKQLSEDRELLGKQLFRGTDPLFAGSKLDIRACISIMLAGVYYLTLHANATGGEFCEVDLKKGDGKKRIKTALGQMVSLCYDFVKKDEGSSVDSGEFSP